MTNLQFTLASLFLFLTYALGAAEKKPFKMPDQDGKRRDQLLTKGTNVGTTYLFVGKLVWGKGGEPDSFVPYHNRT